MSSPFDKHQKRRLISSYFSVVISIALVLFLLGLLGMLVLNAKTISDNFKERVVMTIYLNNSAKKVEINQLEKSLALSNYVKSTKYVSKEDAADFMKGEYGEDFLDDVGYNPLQNSIDVNLKAEFVTAHNLDSISQAILNKKFVEEVRYDKDLVSIMNSNVKRISFWILIISALFSLIAVLLINSSIRLAVYSKRFIIKTMQMVGATKQFIRRPFIWKSVRLGIIGSILALIGMAIVFYYLNKSFPELELLSNRVLISSLFVGIFALGIIITWISTYFATQRFLNLKTDSKSSLVTRPSPRPAPARWRLVMFQDASGKRTTGPWKVREIISYQSFNYLQVVPGYHVIKFIYTYVHIFYTYLKYTLHIFGLFYLPFTPPLYRPLPPRPPAPSLAGMGRAGGRAGA